MVYRKCFVCGFSTKDKSDNRSFFKLPKTPERKKVWIKRLGINESSISTFYKICNVHFPKDQLERCQCRLKRKALPLIEVNEENKENDLRAVHVKSSSVTQNREDVVLHPINLKANNDLTSTPKREKLTRAKRTLRFKPIAPKPILYTEVVPPHTLTPLSLPQFTVSEDDLSQSEGHKETRSVQRAKSEIQRSSVLRKKLKAKLQQNRRLQGKLNITEAKTKLLKNIEKLEKIAPSFFLWIKNTLDCYGKNKKSNFSITEKTTALTIFYSCGQKGYRTLQQIGFKLPALGTLKKWIAPLDFQAGLNPELLELIRLSVLEMSDCNKDCVIVWDEMSIKECLQFDKFRDKFEGIEDLGEGRRNLEVATEVLVVMVASIKSGWKFPVSFYYSKSNTTSNMLDIILKENLEALTNVGLRVRIGICDMSFTNQGLYRRLGVTCKKPFINFRGSKIYMIHDVPHLLKLFRNNLMTKTFFFGSKLGARENKKFAKWKYIREFYNKDTKLPSRMAPRLTKHHINVKDYSKMKVKLATQLFSHTVYSGIKTMMMLGIMNSEARGTADFVKIMDELFDLLNISKEKDNKKFKSALYLSSDLEVLDKYINFVQSLEVSENATKPDCFYGLELTLKGIKGLIQDLKLEGYRYVLTRRLQQDCLENLFSFIRSKGGWSKNPTARQFRHNSFLRQ